MKGSAGNSILALKRASAAKSEALKERLRAIHGECPLEMLRDFAEMGYGYSAIAEILEVSDTTVARWAKKLGVTVRPWGRAEPNPGPGGKATAQALGHWIEFGGERLTKRGWAEKLGISNASLRKRLRKWPLEKALSLPKQKSKGNLNARPPKPSKDHYWRK